MLNRADFVIHADIKMMATHEAEAAKWRLVADTIRMLTDDRFMESVLPAQPYEVLRRH
jgi:hypothetical protein